MKLLTLLASLFISTFTLAQTNFVLDPSLPITPLNESTKLSVLNSRLGSRFSLSYIASERGMHTGALGFDNDQFRELLIEVETTTGKACFRTSGLPQQVEYLRNQTMRIGMTAMQLEGEHPDGLKVVATIVSPFTPTASLDDTEGIKTQISPTFYIMVKVLNKQTKNLSGKVKLAFKATPHDRDKELAFSWWRRGTVLNTLYFKDVSAGSTLLALSGTRTDLRHFDEEAFNGLAAEFDLKQNEEFNETFTYAAYHSEKVMQHVGKNMALKFYYTKFWKNIDEVLVYAKDNRSRNIGLSQKFEQVLSRSKASPQEKWVTAISFHTDLANSFLLLDEKEQPGFYLTEGRFRHLNTIDVAHETELNALFCPWRLKLQLEQWSDYIATKEVKVPSGRSLSGIRENTEGVSATEFGPFLFHDVGNFPYVFSAEGYDFGPMMPVEENATYVMLMYWYWKMTGDDAFVKRHLGLMEMLMQSMLNRDSDDSGIADYGVGWSTYDVSEAIKRSPENVYLGVKQMCAYVAGAEMLKSLPQKATAAKNTPLKVTDEDGTTLDGNMKATFEKALMDNRYLRERQSEKYLREAQKIVGTLKKADKKYGYIPVSLDQSFEGWKQYSIVLPEGLFLMGLSDNTSPVLKEAATVLSKTYEQAFIKSQTPYGIKLSSDEDVTWFSKAMVSDIVATYWFGKNRSTANYTYQWNANNIQAYQDGAFSETKAWPGNWYPRGISSLGYLLRERKFKASEAREFLSDLK